MRVDFYHLAATPVERALPRIAERIVEGGGRLLVVAEERSLLARLDAHLWTYRPDSFLPHGLAGEEGEADQLVLLSNAPVPLNAARAVALVDGRWREEALAFDRAFHFFDSLTIDAARAAWRGLAGRDGIDRYFWRQDEAGRWKEAG
ncbi:DNA polymerase III subunit chi [Flavisphingomonas formosensis]|uniref:DNA polymerase III subunit chi n=1 Tax=Flavisphingomonas formosensis TaxID=861534 RepID=UPI0012FCA6A1|nr:DNA polymerase III subunit chi [Sphingomonas formosensis]